MESESFSDEAIASELNRNFIPIKVDREERPDIDKIYMSYVIGTTGSGGWPMTVFLTPDAKPFYGGTYFPPEDRYGRPGLPKLLGAIAEAWASRRPELYEAGERASRFLGAESPESGKPVSLETLYAAWRQFASGFDAYNGGFGSAPKFPSGHSLSFLIRFFIRTGEKSALDMAVRTLEEMARGGIYDHVGGGFHRYSVDAMWRVPHFEKMLYDQAMLLMAYADAFSAAPQNAFRNAARETAAYVIRELRSPEGGFYSAEDADSAEPDALGHKREGAYYVWTKQELDVLCGVDAEIFSYLYGVESGGNAPFDPQGEFAGRNILYRAREDAQAAEAFGRAPEEIALLRSRSLAVLAATRAIRPRPHLDDKILTDWNGLMIASLGRASTVFGEREWREAAVRAAEFMLKSMRRPDGGLWHRYRVEDAAVAGQHDDYAFMLHGLLELHDATLDPKWIEESVAIADKMIGEFWDGKGGGFFMVAEGSDPLLIMRPKESTDGAVPSGNSIAALALLRLGRLTGLSRFTDYGYKTLEAFAAALAGGPTAYAQMLQALDFAVGPVYEVVLAGEPDGQELMDMLREVRKRVIPNRVILLNPPGPRIALEGKATAYVCRDGACEIPSRSLTALIEQLSRIRLNLG